MKLVKTLAVLIAITTLNGNAFADVARTASGVARTEAGAIAAAKESASANYGDKVTSWGASHCSSYTIHPNQYDPSVTATEWNCQVDFMTSK